MSQNEKPNPEVQPKAERRRFSADYKRRIVAEAAPCKHGELGALLRGEGLTYTQLILWRKAAVEGRLTEKRRGPLANPHRAEVRRLERAEAIIDAQKKLAALLDSSKEEGLS